MGVMRGSRLEKKDSVLTVDTTPKAEGSPSPIQH